MKTIELSFQESRRWDDESGEGKTFQREALAREQARADRLGTSVEVCHHEGHVLEVLQPSSPRSPN